MAENKEALIKLQIFFPSENQLQKNRSVYSERTGGQVWKRS